MPLNAIEVAEDQQEQVQRAVGMEDDAQARHQRADHGETDPGQHRLDGAGDVQSQDQLEFA